MRGLLIVLFMAVARPVLALSCLPADVVRDYQHAAQDSAEWVIVSGTLQFDASQLPKTDLNNQPLTPPSTDVPARIIGKMLSGGGFDSPVDAQIILRARCFGPWCAQPSSDTPYLAFLKKEGARYIAQADPCGSFLHPNPSKAQERQIVRCFKGKRCEPKTR
jgi:hypothetical protein